MKKLIYIITILLIAISASATDYYVDFTATGNDTGTSPTNAFSSWSALNLALILDGSSVYFKKGQTFTLTDNSDRYIVTFSGTAENPSIIGCYDSEGDFDCGSTPYVDGNRPIISGNNNQYPGNYMGAIQISGKSYITIQDLKFLNVGLASGVETLAIHVNLCDNITIDNNYLYRAAGGILISRTDTAVLSRNYASQIGYPTFVPNSGAAFEITAANIEGQTTNITVKNNIVSNSKYEGIGFYKGVTNSVMEYNVVRDCKSYHLYNASSPDNKIRYNLVYESSDNPGGWSESEFGISTNVEAFRDGTAFDNNNVEIYGNLVAGMNIGISMGCSEKFDGDAYDSSCYDGGKIYNNTLVDNNTNIRLWDPSSSMTLDIKNNLSRLYTTSTIHTNSDSAAGVTWANNLWYGIDAVSGNAATNAVNSEPLLPKSSGWRSLTPDELDGTEFTPGTGSPALGAGQTITNFMTFIVNSDFTANPISVTVETDADGPAPIGAWNTGYIPDPEPPTPDDAIGMAIIKGNLLAVKGNLVAGYQAAVTPAATTYSDALSERTPASNPLGDGWTQTDGTAVTSTIAAITTPAGFSNYAWQITGVSTDYPLIRFDTGLAGEDSEVLMLLYRDDAMQAHAASRIPASAADADDAYTGGYRNYSDFARTYKALSGSYSILDTVSHGLTPYDTWLWLRYRTLGTSLYLRCWEDGDAEPGTWLITTTGQSDLTTGKNGIMLVTGDPSYSTYIAYYSIGVGSGVAAPSP